MNKRIKEICSVIDKTKLLIDVGSDHAYLPIYCVKQNIAKSAVVTDINSGPIKRASTNISRYDLLDQITTKKCSGLDGIELYAGNTIVIAGMGGELIADILKKALSRLDDSMQIILQPATSADTLKSFLFCNGFDITKEVFFLYRSNPYLIIKAKKSKKDKVTFGSKDLYVPVTEISDQDSALKEYMRRTIKRQSDILMGYIHSKDERTNKQERLIKELNTYYDSL